MLYNRKLLPEPFESYIQKRKNGWSTDYFNSVQHRLRFFLKWLESESLTPSKLTPEDLQAFSRHLKCIYTKAPLSRLLTRNIVQTCLVNLCKSGEIKNDYTHLFPGYKYFPRFNSILPMCAKNYLELLESTMSSTSVKRLKIDVGRVHTFLKKEKVPLKKVRRKHLEKLLKYMKSYGLSPPTRVRAILTIRQYLYWLKEHNLILAMPEDLIQQKDFPKIARRLPRPFSSEIDNQIQKIFYDGEDIYYDGLLLMRFTGIRVGELILLEFNCLRNDNKHNYYLKVPLGKLKTERLVPIAKVSIELIKKIQTQTKLHAKKNGIKILDRLLLAPNGHHATYVNFRARINEIQTDLHFNQSAKSHQLRHTCATELLNAGMNLVALKEFLGHKDINMTLKYAAVAPETVRKQFNQATEQIQKKYQEGQIDLDKILPSIDDNNDLNDLIAKLKKSSVSNAKSKALIRRIQRLQKDMSSFNV
jgi:site-specific recombinase XerD